MGRVAEMLDPHTSTVKSRNQAYVLESRGKHTTKGPGKSW